MPALKEYRLFISHAWRYHDEYERIVNMLNKADRFRWKNYSVPKHDPADGNTTSALKKKLKDQMRLAEVIVVLAGVYATHSDWIQFEMDQAEQWKKPILGVEPWGKQRTSTAVRDASDEIVGWNTSSIVSAIRSLA